MTQWFNAAAVSGAVADSKPSTGHALTPGLEPGESEYSWGKGVQASLEQLETVGSGPGFEGGPDEYMQLRAERATDSLDAEAEPNYAPYVRE